MFLNGLSNWLAFIAGDGFFAAAQRINHAKGGVKLIGIHIVPGNQEESQLVGTGEGAIPCRLQTFGIFGQISGFHGGL